MADRDTRLSLAEQFERSLNVLAWFRNNEDGNFNRAARELGMSVPQIRYELQQLMLCGLPQSTDLGFMVDVSFTHTSAHVTEDLGIHAPLRLSPLEAGVLLLSLEGARQALPPQRIPALESAQAKLRALLGSQPAGPTPAEPNTPEEQDLIDLLQVAIDERSLVRTMYRSQSSDTLTERTLIPDLVTLIDGTAYLRAREHAHDSEQAQPSESKHFKLERMDAVTILAPGSAAYAGPGDRSLNPDDPFGFLASTDDASWAEFRLRSDAAWMLEYFPMWRIDDLDDVTSHRADADRSELVYFPYTSESAERFAIAHADRISIEGPEKLKNNVRLRAQRGLSAYSQKH